MLHAPVGEAQSETSREAGQASPPVDILAIRGRANPFSIPSATAANPLPSEGWSALRATMKSALAG